MFVNNILFVSCPIHIFNIKVAYERIENYMQKLIALENKWIDVYDAIADGDHDNWVNFINDRIDFDF